MRALIIALFAVALASAAASAHTDKTPAEIEAMLDAGGDLVVVDVREPSEFCDSIYHPPGHIAGAINMPWNSGYLQAHYGELDPDRATVVVCRSGGRSNAAANFLDGVGFTQVFDMLGGMNAWLWGTVDCYTAGVRVAGTALPSGLFLGSPAPNPFRLGTEIAFAIPGRHGAMRVTVDVYDCGGYILARLMDDKKGPGEYRVTWDGTSASGRPVASGVYFCRLRWNGECLTSRLMAIR